MTRVARTLAVFVMLPAAGCLSLTPVGPITQKMFPPLPAPDEAQANAGPKALPVAPPPPMPALLVTPGEVSTANAQDVARRLLGELEADRTSLATMPSYAEVSYVPGNR